MSMDKIVEMSNLRTSRKAVAQVAAQVLAGCAGDIGKPGADIDECIDGARKVLSELKADVKDIDEAIEAAEAKWAKLG